MDKKTIGAMVLITIIIIAWPFYTKLISPEPNIIEHPEVLDTTKSVAKETVQQPSLELRTDTTTKIMVKKQWWSDAVENDITINTDLYTAVLSNRGGGVLKQWHLKKFKDYTGNQVDFIDPQRNLNLVFKYHDELVNLDKAVFKSSSTNSSVTLSDDQTYTYSYTLTFDSTRQIVFTYTFYNNQYHYDLNVEFKNFDDAISNSEYQLQWISGLKSTEKNSLDDLSFFKSYVQLGEEKEEFDIKESASLETQYTGLTKWVASRTKYFVLFMIPQEKDGIGCSLKAETVHENGKLSQKNNFLSLIMKYEANKIDRFKIYLGPSEFSILNTYNENLTVILEWGWAIIRPLTKAILYTFNFLYGIIPNYGWVIIIFALIVKIVLYPLTHKSYVGMQKMKEVMPRQKEIQKKYKDNPTKMQQEMMKLYKEIGYNPLSGCLPMLIQMPILFPIYNVFHESIDLRQAPFFGWVKDLSVPDTIATLHTGLPFIGDFNVNPLPIFMTILTFVQQKLTPMTPMGDSEDPAQKFNQKFMMYGMPILFFFIFNNFSSGLVLYWTIFNALTMGQQLLITNTSLKK
ncbi:membrane protein insertase YidC [bacterium]|nr:membrane protein insertase YidC [bacterium]